MKPILSRLPYAMNLSGLKQNYNRFLSDFERNYPSGTEIQMLDHYINHYNKAIAAADRNIDRNEKALGHLDDEEYGELIASIENHVFEYGHMVNWLEKKKEFALKAGQPEQIETELTKEHLLKEQNKLIPKVSIKDVFNHFETLTKETNKNDEFYLTNEQLLIFIKSTFVGLNPVKQDFNCKGIIKSRVRKVFYDFYFNNKNKETNQTRLKRKYFNIMNNAFNGFNKNDYTDFAK